MAINCLTVWLQYGDISDDVIELQKGLQKLGYYLKYKSYTLVVDGKFKDHTEAAVKQFQRDNDLKDDGIFGQETCPVWKKKLGLPADTPQESTAKEEEKADNKVVSNSTKKKVILDVAKYNFINVTKANFTIFGLHLRAESISEKDTFGYEKQWSPTNLLNNDIHFYSDHSISPTVEITFDLHIREYKKLRNAFVIIQNQKEVWVLSNLFDSGYYYAHFTKTYDKPDLFKITLKLSKSSKEMTREISNMLVGGHVYG